VRAAVRQLAAAAPPGLALIVGYPERSDDGLFNAAALLRGGKVETLYRKHHLPNHSVFDEQRVFDSGHAACVFACGGLNFGLNICGDIWEPGPATRAMEAGADWLLVPNASPFHLNKERERIAVARSRLAETGLPIVYANMVGGQDELVFDGASFALNADGDVAAQCPAWQGGVFYFEIVGDACIGPQHALPDEDAAVYDALVLAVRDYVGKNGFKGVHLGLSGGIDSALTLTIAADAIGAARVHAVMMPSDYTAGISVEDSRDMVKRLGVKYSENRYPPIYEAFIGQLAVNSPGSPPTPPKKPAGPRAWHAAHGALQQVRHPGSDHRQQERNGYRLRHPLRRHGRRLRRAEGRRQDSCLPAGQLPQPPLRRHPAAHHRPPTLAELRPDQKDQDSLPPYEVLDAILEAYVERDLAARDIVASGYDSATVKKVIRMVDFAEYKRRQAPPGPRITRAISARTAAIPSPRNTALKETCHEENRSHHQAVQTRRSARSAIGHRRHRPHRHRGQGFGARKAIPSSTAAPNTWWTSCPR